MEEGKAWKLSQRLFADQNIVNALSACHALDPGDMDICKELKTAEERLRESSDKFTNYMTT